MLTVLYPQIASYIERLSIGLWPLLFRNEPDPRLLIKTTKEMLLTARVKRGFKVYVVSINLSGQDTICLISAFFDDEDEPLVIFTPIFEDEESRKLMYILKRETLDIHFFDEHNRELLGYTQAVTPVKRDAQAKIAKQILADVSAAKPVTPIIQ